MSGWGKESVFLTLELLAALLIRHPKTTLNTIIKV